HYAHSMVGWNSRMASMQATFLMRLLPKMESLLESRRNAEVFYREYFSSYGSHVKFHQAPEGVLGNGYLSVAILKNHDPADISASLSKKGIGTGRVYPQTMDMQEPAKQSLRVSELEHS